MSRPLDEVLREAENLAQSGVRELLVISQDTAAYGQDIRHRTAFWQGKPLRSDLLALARELSALGIWIRLHYLYPYKSLDALVEMMAEGALLPYLDMPLQHSSPQVLRAMRRPAASEAMLDRIRGWRSRCPELTLRSTFIVGFPGEREADFEGLLEFVEEAQIDRGGCFAYSDIAGAASRALPDQVPEEVKEERQQRLMERLAHISRQRLCQRIGKLETVLIDEVHNDHVIARSAGDAPEIDGVVVIDGAWEVDPGDFVEVEISAADDHDLHARMIGCEEDEA